MSSNPAAVILFFVQNYRHVVVRVTAVVEWKIMANLLKTRLDQLSPRDRAISVSVDTL